LSAVRARLARILKVNAGRNAGEPQAGYLRSFAAWPELQDDE
jgi:hypothetical protein